MLGPCSVDGCDNLVTNKKRMLCTLHCHRFKRTGGVDLQPKPDPERRLMKDGYVWVYKPGHPMCAPAESQGRGRVLEHRVVAYDAYDGQCPPCFWCNEPLTWDTCHIDHLNEDKTNNDFDNLEVTCPTCNFSRGGALAFLRRVSDNRFDDFVRLAKEHVEAYRRNPDAFWGSGG